MNGGEISGNSGTKGGGIMVEEGVNCIINGGFISGNTTISGSGNAIYAEPDNNIHTFIAVGPEAAISGDVYLNDADQHLMIAGPLSHIVSVQPAIPSEDLVVPLIISADPDDCAKIAYNGSGGVLWTG